MHEQALPTKKSSVITAGLALFAMFFGAGNLIFPLMLGKTVGNNLGPAIVGFGLTAVIVPFLGLAAMILFQVDYHRFFGRLGKIPGAMLVLLLQLLLGPLGVIPRLVTLMHAMVTPYFSDLSLTLFNILMAIVIFGCCIRRQRMIGLLGTLLTPLILVSLMALVYVGLTHSSSLSSVSLPAKESFYEGLSGGYNTMDLIAAFLFATLILPHFQKEAHPLQKKQGLFKKMGFSSLIAAALLFLTYVGLCLTSVYHGWKLDADCPPEQMLSAISVKLLGPIGGGIAALAVITACLTTAMTLASIFADYLRKDLCKEKISPAIALTVTLIICTLFANLGFGGIAAFLVPIVQIVYPGLILLTILNLLHVLYGYHRVKLPVFLTFACSAVVNLM